MAKRDKAWKAKLAQEQEAELEKLAHAVTLAQEAHLREARAQAQARAETDSYKKLVQTQKSLLAALVDAARLAKQAKDLCDIHMDRRSVTGSAAWKELGRVGMKSGWYPRPPQEVLPIFFLKMCYFDWLSRTKIDHVP